MSVEVFKQELWEDEILEQFHETSFVNMITTSPTEFKGTESCIFTKIEKGSWQDLPDNGEIQWGEVAGTKVKLTFPHQKYYATCVNDVDQIQTNKDVLAATVREQSSVLAELVDQEVLNYIIDETKAENIMGTIEKPMPAYYPEHAYELLVNLNKMANKNKVPSTGRYFMINPDFLAELEKDPRFTKEYTILENGLLKGTKCMINGTQFICRADNPVNKIALVHKKGTGFAFQISEKPEAIRLQTKFALGIRALTQYGYVQLRDDCTYYAHVTYDKPAN